MLLADTHDCKPMGYFLFTLEVCLSDHHWQWRYYRGIWFFPYSHPPPLAFLACALNHAFVYNFILVAFRKLEQCIIIHTIIVVVVVVHSIIHTITEAEVYSCTAFWQKQFVFRTQKLQRVISLSWRPGQICTGLLCWFCPVFYWIHFEQILKQSILLSV